MKDAFRLLEQSVNEFLVMALSIRIMECFQLIRRFADYRKESYDACFDTLIRYRTAGW